MSFFKKLLHIFQTADEANNVTKSCQDVLNDHWEGYLNHFPDYVIQVDRSGMVLYENRPFRQKQMNQIIGTNVFSHFQPVNRDLLQAGIQRAIDEVKEFSFELPCFNENEWFLIRIIPIVQNTSNPTAFLIFTSISKLKLNESELFGLSELISSEMEVRKRVITTISHELRNPMHVILSYANFLGDTSLNDEQKETLAIIKNSSKNLFYVLDEILDFSKIVTGQFSLNTMDFNLDDLVKQIAIHFKPNADEKGIILQTHNFHLIKDSLTGDKDRLRQVLFQLIGNALKFTQKGAVDITLKMLKHDKNILDFQIIVQDTGIGIEKQNLERIFKSFTQEDEKISRHYSGLGLGLTISRHIIELMGGNLDVFSEKGVGSTFTITLSLPISNNSVRRITNIDEILNNEEVKKLIKSLQVLLVEDEPLQQNIASMALTGWNVTIAGNGEEAIELLRKKNDFDIILMDIRMPVMDGIEVSKFIRSELKLNTPIIAVSGEAFVESTINECIEVGMNDFVPKPYEKAVLIDSIFANINDKKLSFANMVSIYPNQPLAGKKTLFVEDNEINQRVTRKLLEKLGCEIDIAKDGKTAIQKIQNQNFDFFLLDLNLPDMSGFEVSKKIREMYIIAPIIAYSGDDGQETVEKCLNAGMNDLLVKPQKDVTEMGIKIYEIIEKAKSKKLYSIDYLINNGFDKTEIAELVPDFLKSISQSIENFSKFITEGDLKLLRNTAHNLKTSSLNFGVQSVRSNLILIEDYANNLLSNNQNSFRIITTNDNMENIQDAGQLHVDLLIKNVIHIFEEVRKQLQMDFKTT